MCFSPFRPLRSTKKCTKKGVHEALKKLLAHPLVIRLFIVYCARAGRTAIALVQRLRPLLECVCVCYTFIWIDQIKRHKKTGRREILLRCESCLVV